MKVERTPKCHPEIAGEGIEYDWGCAKGVYRRLPISEKRSKIKFRESVEKSMHSTEVLTIERRRLFSKRAREYMLAYSILDKEEMGSSEGVEAADKKKTHMLTAYPLRRSSNNTKVTGVPQILTLALSTRL